MGRELRITGVMLLGAMWLHACSSDSGADGPGGDGGEPAGGSATAGGASAGAHAGVGGKAAAGGDRSDDQGGQGDGGTSDDERGACGPYLLDEFCSALPSACPMSPDDFPLDDSCCFAEVQRRASSCGGTIIQETSELHITTWSYNADGQLVGYMNTGDVSTPCDEGGFSSSVIYGFNCEPQGLPEDLCQDVGNACGAGGAGGASGAGGTAG